MGPKALDPTSVRVRQASKEEMLTLWGYPNTNAASPTARYFYRSIASGSAVFWALDRAGELIGELYAFLNIEEDSDFADGRATAYLCAFRVRRDCRGQGLGHRLMDAALADLRSRGFRRATIGVDNARNERLYRHMGFTDMVKVCHLDPCARDERMAPEPVPEGCLLLAKTLGDAGDS